MKIFGTIFSFFLGGILVYFITKKINKKDFNDENWDLWIDFGGEG